MILILLLLVLALGMVIMLKVLTIFWLIFLAGIVVAAVRGNRSAWILLRTIGGIWLVTFLMLH